MTENCFSRHDFEKTNRDIVEAGKLSGELGDQARNQLLVRYHCAINRYLLARLGDQNAVDDVYEIYVDRVKANHPFLKRYDHEKGRFRHYLRRVLQNLVFDYYRKANRLKEVGPIGEGDFVAPPPTDEQEEQFRSEWVNELMHHAWRALEAKSRASERPALVAACTMTLRIAERAMRRCSLPGSVGAAQVGELVGVNENTLARRDERRHQDANAILEHGILVG